MSFTLRPHQVPAVDAVLDAKTRGIRRQVLALPTGSGKTAVMAYLATQFDGPLLILVHREELLRQTVETLGKVIPADSIGRVHRSLNEIDKRVIVASVPTLARRKRLAQLPTTIQAVFVDEAHHSPAPTYRRILGHLKTDTQDGPFLLGVTATPERKDGKALSDQFDQIVYRKDLQDYMHEGILCDLKALHIKLAADLDSLSLLAGDFREQDLERILLKAKTPELVLQTYQTHATDRARTLIFAPTVTTAAAIAETFTQAGHTASVIHGKTPSKDRQDLREQFRDGRLKVLVNCQVFTEGFDEPLIDCVIMARPTTSKGLYLQMLGRGTRLAPGKKDCLVLDCAGNTTTHDVITVASLFQFTPDELSPVSVRTKMQEASRRNKTVEITASKLLEYSLQEQDLPLSAEVTPVDLFGRRPFRWLLADVGAYVLPFGLREILIAQHQVGTLWQLLQVKESGSTITLASGQPLQTLLAKGERLAREHNLTPFLTPTAPWRNYAPSEKQIAALTRAGVLSGHTMTRGEASDRLTMIQAHTWLTTEPRAISH